MRLLAAGLCLCVLAACEDRRSFDDRYNDTSAELEQRARALDQNLADQPSADEAGENSTS